ncbi:MAG: ImmA/IrrE family metallo-endopeptidase [Acidobacteriota bacterium]
MRDHVLPDWWTDELADVAANRALAEGYIAKQLGFRLRELRDAGTDLTFPAMADVRFKRYKNQVDDRVKVSALLAQRVARVVAGHLKSRIPEFLPAGAGEIRKNVLQKSKAVDLGSLLGECWRRGIIVLHLAEAPKRAKRFDGMACFVEGRPVIVLASNRDSPPWLAFHLAHELGHIMLGHVGPEQPYLVDDKLDNATGSNAQEREADRFACEVLTGFESKRIGNLKQNGPRLATTAAMSGPREGIDPGVFALIYAKSNDRWGVAQKALSFLSLDRGGRAQVNQVLSAKLDLEDLSESDERLLSVLALTPT